MLWLIDNRGRLLDGKRHLWTWPDDDVNANRSAWDIVLRAEIPDQADRDDYAAFADHDMPYIYVSPLGLVYNSEARGLCDTFNDFWSTYGWELCWADNDDEPLAEDIVVMNNKPARECYGGAYAPPEDTRGFMTPENIKKLAADLLVAGNPGIGKTDGRKIVFTPSGVSICSFCGGSSADENPHEDWCRYQ